MVAAQFHDTRKILEKKPRSQKMKSQIQPQIKLYRAIEGQAKILATTLQTSHKKTVHKKYNAHKYAE